MSKGKNLQSKREIMVMKNKDMPEKIDLRNGRQYLFVREIGSGSGGSVFKVVFNAGKVRQERALKILNPLLVENEKAIQNFEDEAGLISNLKHRHIVQVFDYGILVPGNTPTKFDNCPYLVMDFLQGCDLEDMIKSRGVLDPIFASSITIQICKGLAHAHQKGIVHRDMKPLNVFLKTGTDGETLDLSRIVRILDFGIAGIQGNLVEGITGTPEYMPPEQLHASEGDTISPGLDIYSTGALMYQMLSGRPPFMRADSEDLFEFLSRVEHTFPEPLRAINPDVPGGLLSVVEMAMQKDPRDRFESINELKEAVAECSSGNSIYPIPKDLSEAESSGDPDEAPEESQKKSHPKLLISAVAVGSVLVGLLGGLGMNFFSERQEREADPVIMQDTHDAGDSSKTKLPVKTVESGVSIDAEKVTKTSVDEDVADQTAKTTDDAGVSSTSEKRPDSGIISLEELLIRLSKKSGNRGSEPERSDSPSDSSDAPDSGLPNKLVLAERRRRIQRKLSREAARKNNELSTCDQYRWRWIVRGQKVVKVPNRPIATDINCVEW
jgi:serine/threonine protein kinase